MWDVALGTWLLFLLLPQFSVKNEDESRRNENTENEKKLRANRGCENLDFQNYATLCSGNREMSLFAWRSLFGQIYACFDVFSLFLAVFAGPRILAILDVIPMSPWNWKFTFLLALFFVLVKQ